MDELKNIKVSTQEKNEIKKDFPDTLPLNPTAQGFSGAEIRRRLSKSITGEEGSVLSLFVDKMDIISDLFHIILDENNDESLIEKIKQIDGDIENILLELVNKVDKITQEQIDSFGSMENDDRIVSGVDGNLNEMPIKASIYKEKNTIVMRDSGGNFQDLFDHNASPVAHQDIRNMIAALQGGIIPRGLLQYTTDNIRYDKTLLDTHIQNNYSREAQLGDMVRDLDNIEWYYNGEFWDELGPYSLIPLASMYNDGLISNIDYKMLLQLEADTAFYYNTHGIPVKIKFQKVQLAAGQTMDDALPTLLVIDYEAEGGYIPIIRYTFYDSDGNIVGESMGNKPITTGNGGAGLTDLLKDNYDVAYAHSQIVEGNPHGVTAEQVDTYVKTTIDNKDANTLQEAKDYTDILDERVDTIIAGTVEGVSGAEIVDARQGEVTLGANITKVKSQLDERTTYNSPKMLNIGELSDNKPIISFIDDDIAVGVNTRLLPIFTSKNVPFASAVITGVVGTPNYMTLAQLKECHETGLYETLSHTVDVMTNLKDGYTDEQLHYQFKASQDWLKNNGFEHKGFVYPQSNHDLNIRKIMRQYYDYSFGKIGFNEKGYLDHSLIERIAFGSYTTDNPTVNGNSEKNTLAYYKACVDYAVANKTWLIFMLHVSAQSVEQDAILGQLIDYIKSLNVEILKPSEAFKRKANKLSVGDVEENHIFIGESNFHMNIGDYQILRFPIDSINSTDKPNSFANGKLSYCEIVNNVTGYPESRPGVLIVDKVIFSSSKSRQIFRVYKGGATNGLATYERYMINNDTYSEWKKVGDDLSLYLEKITTHVDLPVLYGVNSSGAQAQYKMRATAIPDSVPVRRTYGFLTNVANTTSNRPNTNLLVGDMFFDTTLGKPVWWNGTAWTDATGTVV